MCIKSIEVLIFSFLFRQSFLQFAINQNNKIEEEKKISQKRGQLKELIETYPESKVALEAGTGTQWISSYLEDLGAKTIIANPGKLRAIYQNERKSDRLDALMLAKLAFFDLKLLYPVKYRSKEKQRDLQVIKSRENLVRARTRLINSLRASVKNFGYRLPKCSAAYFHVHAGKYLQQKQQVLPDFSICA